MPQYMAISKKHHADKSWTRFDSYQFAAKDNLAPLVGAEVAKAVLALPMAFIKQQDNFVLVAVLSLTPGQNMFVAPNGQWLGAYVPSVFRGYPFRLARAEGRDDLILCIDEDSGLISDTEGEPFFDENGELSQQVKNVLDFLSQIEQNRIVTQQAVSALAEAGVITEWNLKVKTDEQETPITGLYVVDEAKLNTLDDPEFLKLRQAQALPIAYAQLLSMANISVFEKLRQLHEQQNQQARTVDTSSIFGDDDTFKF